MKNNVISYTLTIYRHHKGKSKFVLSVEWSVDVANLNLHPVKVKLDARCTSYNHFLKDALAKLPNHPTLLSMREIYGDEYNLFTPISPEQLKIVETWEYTKKST